jgi:glutathione peroxidase
MKRTSILCLLGLVLTAMNTNAASLYDIPLKDIHGKDTSLKAFQGKTLLVVNVASKCGLTPQYEALEALYQKYKSKGLVILGFPCNQFKWQEPGSSEEILKFCTTKYHVTFPLFEKLEVKGAGQHPLYKALTGPDSKFPGDVKWNFGKFLISRNGVPLHRFEPRTPPDSPEVLQAIESALAEK